MKYMTPRMKLSPGCPVYNPSASRFHTRSGREAPPPGIWNSWLGEQERRCRLRRVPVTPVTAENRGWVPASQLDGELPEGGRFCPFPSLSPVVPAVTLRG